MNNIYIIFDCSGSIVEMGHTDVIKEAFLIIRRGYPDIKIFKWNDKVETVSKAKEIMPQGQADVTALTDFLSDCEEDARLLLVSDGVWNQETVERISAVIGNRCLLTCVVGEEADAHLLQKVQTQGTTVARMADFPGVMRRLAKG